MVKVLDNSPRVSDATLDQSLRPDRPQIEPSTLNRLDPALSSAEFGNRLRVLTGDEIAQLARGALQESYRGEEGPRRILMVISNSDPAAARAALPALAALFRGTDLERTRTGVLDVFKQIAGPEDAALARELALIGLAGELHTQRKASFDLLAKFPDRSSTQQTLDSLRREKHAATREAGSRAVEACLSMN